MGHITSRPGLNIIWRSKADTKTYEEARTNRLFNALTPDRYPLAVVFAKTESDIVDTINLAKEKKCRVSIRAGGHSYASWSVRDEAILLDLGGLEGLTFDDETNVVTATPNMTSRELIDYLSPKGRVVSVGHCPDVGVGGFLLGGGLGWNVSNWGWSCEQVIAVEVVTADGQILRADDQQNSDLFWAARGGGPAFPGVVTRFHIQTKPIVQMRSSGYIYPMSLYKTAFQWALQVLYVVPKRDLELMRPQVPSQENGKLELVSIGSYIDGLDEPCITIAMIAYGDDESSIRDLLKRVDDGAPDGALSSWLCEKTSLPQELDRKAEAYPNDHRYYVDNAWIKNDADIVAVLEPAFTNIPTRESLVLWQSMKPCSRRQLPDMAVSLQSDHYLSLYGIWKEENDDIRCQSRVKEIMLGVAPRSVGSYLGELDFRSRETAYWGEEQRKRLVDVRTKWDTTHRICGCLGLQDMDNK